MEIVGKISLPDLTNTFFRKSDFFLLEDEKKSSTFKID
jgi:hypothetical protein